MGLLRNLRSRFGALFSKKRLGAEMDEEMRLHLELLTEHNIEAGMSPEEARYAAQRKFGGVEQLKERGRDERGFVWIEQLWQDMRYAVRSLAKSPSFTITAVLTLAFGIGVNAALFTLYNSVALKSLPVKEPDRLVSVIGRTSKGALNGNYSYAEYLAYRDGNHALEGLMAFTEKKQTFQREGEAPAEPDIDGGGLNKVTVEMVSENYFEVLGEVVQFGRGFRLEEFRTGAAVIVLSHAFWKSQLQSDPNVIGTSLRFDRLLYTVIGVAPTRFSGKGGIAPAGWLPYSQWSPRLDDYAANGPRVFGLIGRLKPGVSEAQANADLDTIAAKWAADFPGETVKTSIYLRGGLRFVTLDLSSKGLIALGTLFFGFSLVLMIACTNVANLLFARGVSRQTEIGVRLALGASRGRIIRQLLAENGLLCLGGAVVGLGLGIWTLQIVVTKWLAPLAPPGFPEFDVLPDFRVFGFTALLTLGATLAAGLLPALHASRASLSAALHNEGTAFGRRLTPTRLRQILLVVQVAVCLMLLACWRAVFSI